jgi:hypothetical protein
VFQNINSGTSSVANKKFYGRQILNRRPKELPALKTLRFRRMEMIQERTDQGIITVKKNSGK